jgi:hypothetical protein
MKLLNPTAHVVACAALVSLTLSQVDAAGDPIKLPKASSAFITATKALTGSASEYVQLERTTDRLRLIRSELAKKLLNASATSKIPLDGLVEERALLCDSRVSHLTTLARLSYLNSVTSQVDEIAKVSKPDDILSAITLLFAKYSIDGTAKSLDPAALKSLGDRTRARCEKDIKGFDVAYYGVEIKAANTPAAPAGAEAPVPPASALLLLGPLGALIDTFLNIINPVAIGAATLVDEGKREKAIQDFLADPKNQQNLKDIGDKIGKAASGFNWDKRLQLAASFVEGVRVIERTELDLSKFDECKDLSTVNLGRTASGAPSSAFMRCWRKAWSQLDPIVSSILKAGNDYDLLADAGDTDTPVIAFHKVADDLNAVSTNAVSDPEVLWMFVTQVLTFATTVQTAFSQDNRDKLHKAIDALVKAP